MADYEESNRKDFSNWVQNILALNITKTSLHKHVLDKWAAEIGNWKIPSLEALLQFFNEVENGVVRYRHKERLECSQSHSHCSIILNRLNALRQDETFTISCKTVLCTKIVNKDIKESDAVGVLREISGESLVRTNKTGPQVKCNDYSSIFEGCKTIHIWCLANMFMQSGSFKNNICNTGPGDTDSAMFFRMMKNCKLFELDGDLYQEVIDVRNRLCHSATNRLKTQDSKINLEAMKTLLKQFPDAECKDAIKNIDEMEHHTFFLGEVKKALYLKTFALDTDTKIDRAKGYSCGDVEELRKETKEQFQQTDLVQLMTLKSTEDIKKENAKYAEMIEELKYKRTCLEMDLQDELTEHTKNITKLMKETDFQTGDKRKAEDLLAYARHVRSSFDELKEHRLKTPIGNKKATENQKESSRSEGNGHQAKKNTMGIGSRNDTSTPERAVSVLREDLEDFIYDIDEIEIFQDRTSLEPNKTSGSYETSNLPFESFSKCGRRFIASVNFKHTVTQFTVLPSKFIKGDFRKQYTSIKNAYLQDWTTEQLSNEILLNRMKEVEEYGSKATDRYYNLDQNENPEQYFYFESLRIDGSVGLTKYLKIEDVTGRSMNAVDVYGAAIKYLKGKIVDKAGSEGYKELFDNWTRYIYRRVEDADLGIDYNNITDDDIFWVFTEPAVSSFDVKSCIIEAAGKAGIQNEHVAVIPEPVATLVYCTNMPEYKYLLDEKDVLSFDNYTKYLIMDAREQTVTISTYEVTDQNIFKELEVPVEYTVGQNVAYEDFVTEVIGNKSRGQSSSSEADIIVLVGQARLDILQLGDALSNKFPKKRFFIPRILDKAPVLGAEICCFTQLTVIK